MCSKTLKVGAGGLFSQDHETLVSFFEGNYELKKQWRMKMGVPDERALESALTQEVDLEIEKGRKIKAFDWNEREVVPTIHFKKSDF